MSSTSSSSSASPLPFAAIGRLPAPGDNVAIAVRRLDSETRIALDGSGCTLSHMILEGHRFAVRSIEPGEPLLSWGLPFGHALRRIVPGEYVCNASILETLAMRQLGFPLPAQPNFEDHLVPFELDETSFRPGAPVEPATSPRTFAGYRRPGCRGVGTRNYVVVLGTTSRTAAFARQLAARLQTLARIHPTLDGIVAVAHTEGGGPGEPNNANEVLRALAGFMVHPNVGAVLAVDQGSEPINNARLRAFMQERGYPLGDVLHDFLSIRRGLATALAEGEAIVRRWLPVVAEQRRTPEPLAELRVALQCGGSDAFSGVSGNPLAGAIVHEVVRHGGTGVLCETDELSGAESYLVKNVRDLATVRALLDRIDRFRTRLSWHGVTAEGNPSGGNKLRGLYNITLKSLGAVHKKDPRTRIDHVIDYAEPLTGPGFTFMDSPGNDLEGIAGQVGSGCNLFLFVTGNGSITNFPFVPTLKITTTTRRHQLLIHEMDINAGRYLDGESMESLTTEGLDLVIATASGQRTRGELAGHSQTSLWRNWRQTDESRLAAIRSRVKPDGRPLRPAAASPRAPLNEEASAVFRVGARFATERVGLVLPTSMCAAQIARLATQRLNDTGIGRDHGIERYVALPHTEGCGFSGDTTYDMLLTTYLGYATHPNVATALLLEHGCEKIPNDAMRRQFEAAQLPLEQFGWASVQLDGGIEKVLARITDWFDHAAASLPAAAREPAGLGALHIAFLSAGPVDDATAAIFADTANTILASGGSVLLPEGDPLLASAAFRGPLLGSTPPRATLAYGQALTTPGLHLVETDTDHWEENLAGLGACGAHVIAGFAGDAPRQAHPLLAVLQVAAAGTSIAREDVDLVLTGTPSADASALAHLIARTAERSYVPVANAGGFVEFQLTRGLLGVST